MLQILSPRRLSSIRSLSRWQLATVQSSRFQSSKKTSTIIPFSYLVHDFMKDCGGKEALSQKSSQQVFENYVKPHARSSVPSLLDLIPSSSTSNLRFHYYVYHDQNAEFLEIVDRLQTYFTKHHEQELQNIGLHFAPFSPVSSERSSVNKLLKELSSFETNKTLVVLPSNYDLFILQKRDIIFHMIHNHVVKAPMELLYPIALQGYSQEQLSKLSARWRDFFSVENYDFEKLIDIKSNEDQTAFVNHVERYWKIPLESIFPIYEQQLETLFKAPFEQEIQRFQKELTDSKGVEGKDHVLRESILRTKYFLSALQMILPPKPLPPPSSSSSESDTTTTPAKSDPRSAVQKKQVLSPKEQKTDSSIFSLADLSYAKKKYGPNSFETQRIAFALFPTIVQSSSTVGLIEAFFGQDIYPFLTSDVPVLQQQMALIYPETPLLEAFLSFGERKMSFASEKTQNGSLLEQFQWIQEYYSVLLQWMIPILGSDHPNVLLFTLHLLGPHQELVSQYVEFHHQQVEAQQQQKKANKNRNKNNNEEEEEEKMVPVAMIEKVLRRLSRKIGKIFGEKPLSGPAIELQLMFAQLRSIYSEDIQESLSEKDALAKELVHFQPIITALDELFLQSPPSSPSSATLDKEKTAIKGWDDFTFESLMLLVDYFKEQNTLEALKVSEQLLWKSLLFIGNEHQLLDGLGEFMNLSLQMDRLAPEDSTIQGADYPAYAPYRSFPVFEIDRVLETLAMKDEHLKQQEQVEARARGGEEEENEDEEEENKKMDFTKNIPIHPMLNLLGRIYFQQGQYDLAVKYYLAHLKELYEFRTLLEKLQQEQIELQQQQQQRQVKEKEAMNMSKTRQKQIAKAQGRKWNQGKLKNNDPSSSTASSDSTSGLLSEEEVETLETLKQEAIQLMDRNMIAVYACHLHRADQDGARPFFETYHRIRNRMIKDETYAMSRELNLYFAHIAKLEKHREEAIYFFEALHYLQSPDAKDFFRSIDFARTNEELARLFQDQEKEWKLSLHYHQQALELYRNMLKKSASDSSRDLEEKIKSLEESMKKVEKALQEKKAQSTEGI